MQRTQVARDVGLLILRVSMGSMMITHGWHKLTGFSEMSGSFPDPVGIGAAATLAIAVFAEFFCSAFVIAGFLTRLAAVPIAATMAGAALIHHAADPMKVKELPFVYLAAFTVIALAGAGKLSVDGIRGRAD